MDRSATAELKNITYTTDAIGNRVPTATWSTVFCNIQSVSRAEFYEAGQQGLRAEYKLTMFGPDYAGQECVKLNNVEYTIYRTYIRQDEQIELYLTKKAANG